MMNVRGRFGPVTGRMRSLIRDRTGTTWHNGVAQREGARDKHLRWAELFDVANHPTVVFAIETAQPNGDAGVRITGNLTAAGKTQSITFDGSLSDATLEHFTVDGQVSVDRRAGFGMNWSPLGMASATAVLVVHAQFAKWAPTGA